MDYPRTRAEAKATGVKYYFTGTPCRRGHISLRETKGNCTECRKIDSQVQNVRRLGQPRSEAMKAAGRRYYEKNKELVIARARSQEAEKRRAYRKAWKERNPEETQASANAWKRRARHATPKWLTDEHKKQIREFYLTARRMTKNTGVKHTVDHILPLRSPDVCGLHVPWNLQILTHVENCEKSNKLEW